MIKMPAHFTGFSSRADGSAGMRFSTQELTSDDFANLKQALNGFGWLVFASQEEKVDVPTEAISDETKKPSARLRACFYLLWKKKGEVGDFELFYRGQMELIIDRIKGKLD